ncbi:MAG: hypothetical protein CM1200mP4_2350 [Rhodospirillaceae bacterium]|nr:MAG: hypothetical protein CM1200mP4_2350 [Rhodospirillaceae bacterium]
MEFKIEGSANSRWGEEGCGTNNPGEDFPQGTAAVSLGVFSAPYIKTSHSAGKLKMGVWDHWIPGSNAALEAMLQKWGEANGVEIEVDFISSVGNKLLLTAQAESRAGIGHDIYFHGLWMPNHVCTPAGAIR